LGANTPPFHLFVPESPTMLVVSVVPTPLEVDALHAAAATPT